MLENKLFHRLGEQAELKSKIKSGITNIFVSLIQRHRLIQLSCNFFIRGFTNLNGDDQDHQEASHLSRVKSNLSDFSQLFWKRCHHFQKGSC